MWQMIRRLPLFMWIRAKRLRRVSYINDQQASECPWNLPVGTMQQLVVGEGKDEWVFKRVVAVTTQWHLSQGWGSEVGRHYWQYYCPECDRQLTPGPSGGGTNQVCEHCHINWGCLPGALQR